MIRLFVRHSVADFGQWKTAYDDFGSERLGLGVLDHGVYRSLDDPTAVTVWHDTAVTVWHDMDSEESARALAESPRLRAAMASAGVVGTPTNWITRPA